MSKEKHTDESLAVLLAKGNTEAFDQLFDRYAHSVEYFFYRMLWGDKEKAADFTQELFLKVVEHIGSFDPRRTFKTWLFSMANNMCKNEYRKQEVRKNAQVDLIHGAETRSLNGGDTQADREVFFSALEQALEKEHPDKKSAFILRYVEETPLQEISEMLNIPVGTVKSGLHYTCKKLSTLLNAYKP